MELLGQNVGIRKRKVEAIKLPTCRTTNRGIEDKQSTG